MFQELRAIAEMKFRFAEEEDACEYVTRLASEIHLYPPAHALKVTTNLQSCPPMYMFTILCQTGQSCAKPSHSRNALPMPLPAASAESLTTSG